MPPKKRKPGAGRPKAAEPINALAALKGTDKLEKWLDGLVRKAGLRTRVAALWKGLILLAEHEEYRESMPDR